MVTLAVPTLAVLQLGPCASCRAALGSVYSQGGRPAQWAPSHLPRVLELAASKAADFTAFDNVGASTALLSINDDETSSCLDMAAAGGMGSIGLLELLLGHPAYPVEHRPQALQMMLSVGRWSTLPILL